MTDDLEITRENGVAAESVVIPRMGDEIVLPDGKVLLVLSVQRAKTVVEDAAGRAPEMEAHLRATMGDYWRQRYWKAMVRHRKGGSPFWIDVMDMNRLGGVIEAHHREMSD